VAQLGFVFTAVLGRLLFAEALSLRSAAGWSSPPPRW